MEKAHASTSIFVLGGILGCFTLSTAACTPPGIVVPTDETGDTGDTSDTSDTSDTGEGDVPLQLSVNKDVDILFVIDNSGSMGEEQAILAQNFAAFIQVLEDPSVAANYRIGITTSDNGNPWCPAGQTTPESGKLVASSCKTRLDDFIFNNGAIDVQDLACNDICALDQGELEILPTPTDVDPNETPRPWLERIEGKQNIPQGTLMSEAFECFGPQGINGCGFESQLESMYLALVRMQNQGEASYGFLRAGALLSVIILTDEADCSYNKDWSEIFDADGNKVFWSDPNAAFPTSAVCWNAGVECFGDPNNYDGCEPQNRDVNGNSAVGDDEAVLHPVSRYSGLLAGLEAQQQELNPEHEILVSLIGGVGSNGEPFYSDVSATDPSFQDSFGIGPGCSAPNPLDPDNPVTAIPPVRLRAVVDAFSPGNMFSICEPDYSVALSAIAERISDQIQPSCYSLCVEDSDPQTEIVEPSCVVEQDPPGLDNHVVVPECLRGGDGAYVVEAGSYTMPSDADNVCVAMRVDTQMFTPSSADDMSQLCSDQNFNLEFAIERRPGFPAPGGTALSASCTLAAFPEVTCPGFGG